MPKWSLCGESLVVPLSPCPSVIPPPHPKRSQGHNKGDIQYLSILGLASCMGTPSALRGEGSDCLQSLTSCDHACLLDVGSARIDSRFHDTVECSAGSSGPVYISSGWFIWLKYEPNVSNESFGILWKICSSTKAIMLASLDGKCEISKHTQTYEYVGLRNTQSTDT